MCPKQKVRLHWSSYYLRPRTTSVQALCALLGKGLHVTIVGQIVWRLPAQGSVLESKIGTEGLSQNSDLSWYKGERHQGIRLFVDKCKGITLILRYMGSIAQKSLLCKIHCAFSVERISCTDRNNTPSIYPGLLT